MANDNWNDWHDRRRFHIDRNNQNRTGRGDTPSSRDISDFSLGLGRRPQSSRARSFSSDMIHGDIFGYDRDPAGDEMFRADASRGFDPREYVPQNPNFASYSAGLESGRVTDYSGRGPKGYRRSDERILEEVCDILERHPDIDASEIEVDVKDGLVTLRGKAESRRQKRLAEDVIAFRSGVHDVRNELMVSRNFIERAKDFIDGVIHENPAPKSTATGKGKKGSRH